MARLLAALAVAWPLVLGAGLWSHAHGEPRWVSATVYLVGSRICHQRPERSFHTAGVQWPVCGRCAGLYMAGPVGALAAIARRRAGGRQPVKLFLIAAAPTAATLLVEWFDLAPVSNAARAMAALPLGAMVAFLIVAVVSHSAPPSERQQQTSLR